MYFRDSTEILPGWRLRYDEVSNCVFKIELKDDYGRLAGTTDIDFERGLHECEQYALDIQRQLNTDISEFLYRAFLLKLVEENVTEHNRDAIDGSWYIASETNWQDSIRLTGKDNHYKRRLFHY